jgi:hypothetical protein
MTACVLYSTSIPSPYMVERFNVIERGPIRVCA